MLGVEEIFGIHRNPLGFINYGNGESTIYRIFPAINLHLLRGFSGIFLKGRLYPLKHIETTFIIWESTPQISIYFNGLSGFGFTRQFAALSLRPTGVQHYSLCWWQKTLPKSRYGGFHKWGYPKLAGWFIEVYLSLFHGKSENKMDELGVPPFQETPIWSAVAGWIGPGLGLFGYVAISHQLGKIQFPKCMSTLNAFFLNGYLRIIQVPSSNQTWQLKILTYTYTYTYITYIYIYTCVY